eukprot:gene8581-7830_t
MLAAARRVTHPEPARAGCGGPAPQAIARKGMTLVLMLVPCFHPPPTTAGDVPSADPEGKPILLWDPAGTLSDKTRQKITIELTAIQRRLDLRVVVVDKTSPP